MKKTKTVCWEVPYCILKSPILANYTPVAMSIPSSISLFLINTILQEKELEPLGQMADSRHEAQKMQDELGVSCSVRKLGYAQKPNQTKTTHNDEVMSKENRSQLKDSNGQSQNNFSNKIQFYQFITKM